MSAGEILDWEQSHLAHLSAASSQQTLTPFLPPCHHLDPVQISGLGSSPLPLAIGLIWNLTGCQMMDRGQRQRLLPYINDGQFDLCHVIL